MNQHTIDETTWQQHAWSNRLQSLLLLGLMGGFLALLGNVVWGQWGILLLLIVGFVMVGFTPSIPPHVLMRFYGARPIAPEEAPGLWQLHLALSQRAGLGHVPELYYLPSNLINAFAIGRRSRAGIALSDGLLRQLDRQELAGVLGHELSHIRSNDLWIMTLADVFSRLTSLLSVFGQLFLLLSLPLILLGVMSVNLWVYALLILAPVITALGQLALSRSREYEADLNGVRLTGDPDGLARALAKIEQIQGGWMERFSFRSRNPQPSWLRTHPETRDRIDRLMALRSDFFRLQQLKYAHPELFVFPEPLRVSRKPRRHMNGLWY